MKGRPAEDFGDRLTMIRKARGLTQMELSKKIGVSRRTIAYYERESAQPPGLILAQLADALRVTTDELLGVKPTKVKTDPKSARLMKRLEKIEELPATDRRAVLKILDALLARRAKDNGSKTGKEG